MKLILKEDVEHLGRIGDLVDVARGYARNFLLPRKKGIAATPKNVKEVEHQKRCIALQVQRERLSATGRAEKISAMTVRVPVQVGENGKMFGSVTARDIADALSAQGIDVDRRHIEIEKPIKDLGVVVVPVNVYRDVMARVTVEVVSAMPGEGIGAGNEESRTTAPKTEDSTAE